MQDTKNTTQRPKKDRPSSIYKSELYGLLKDNLPIRFTMEDGRLDTKLLAKEIGMTRYSIYRWLNGELMSPSSIKKLSDLSASSNCERKGALKKEMLTKFVLGF